MEIIPNFFFYGGSPKATLDLKKQKNLNQQGCLLASFKIKKQLGPGEPRRQGPARSEEISCLTVSSVVRTLRGQSATTLNVHVKVERYKLQLPSRCSGALVGVWASALAHGQASG